jgi:hypothetical protein
VAIFLTSAATEEFSRELAAAAAATKPVAPRKKKEKV